jgi:6-phosphogluconolactonase (cycloisomerase 2 family)
MNRIAKLSAAAIAAAAIVTIPASLASAHDRGADSAVFVQTVEATGNHVVAYHRNDDGTLTQTGNYATGGTGAFEPGAVVDPLASQSGLAYDSDHGLLISVNSGSDTVTVFSASGSSLTKTQTIASGGSFPSSVAVHDNLVEVLNAGGAGSVASFRITGDKLTPVTDSVRSLGLSNAALPFFLSAPGQVGFSNDGNFVIVTTKLNGSIETFKVKDNGRLAATPTITASAAVPFAFVVDNADHVNVINAGTGALNSWQLNADGSLTLISAVSDGQKAACWIELARGHYFVANAGSGNISSFTVSKSGQVALQGVAATTGAGPVDLAASEDGKFLYSQQGGAHAVQAFKVGSDGSLTDLGSVTGLPAMEGIVAI